MNGLQLLWWYTTYWATGSCVCMEGADDIDSMCGMWLMLRTAGASVLLMHAAVLELGVSSQEQL